MSSPASAIQRHELVAALFRNSTIGNTPIQVRWRKRRLRAAEDQSVARGPRKRKEKANFCDITPKDLEREGVWGPRHETVDEKEENAKANVSFNFYLLPLHKYLLTASPI